MSIDDGGGAGKQTYFISHEMLLGLVVVIIHEYLLNDLKFFVVSTQICTNEKRNEFDPEILKGIEVIEFDE